MFGVRENTLDAMSARVYRIDLSDAKSRSEVHAKIAEVFGKSDIDIQCVCHAGDSFGRDDLRFRRVLLANDDRFRRRRIDQRVGLEPRAR